MPTETDKWVQAVTKLTELTQAGTLTWSVGSSPIIIGETVAGPAFYAEHSGRRMRVRLVRPVGLAIDPIAKLELLDDEGNLLFAFPEISALFDLYGAAQYQAAGVKGFIDGLIGGDV